jgi:hypothetical protein
MLSKVMLSALMSALAGACLLTGCATSFQRFYEPVPNSGALLATPEATPLFEWSRDPGNDARLLTREGLVLIGTSSFIATTFTPDPSYADQAVTQGIKVGAAVVLLQEDSSDLVADGCCVTLNASYWVWAAPRAPVKGELPR